MNKSDYNLANQWWELEIQNKDNENFLYKDLEKNEPEAKIKYDNLMKEINNTYISLINDYNIPHYIARECLPNSVLCNIFVTVNLRELIHIFKLRLNISNTPEIRLIFKEIYLLINKHEPRLYKVLEQEFEFYKKMI